MMYHDLLLPKMVVKARGKVDQRCRGLTVRKGGESMRASERARWGHRLPPGSLPDRRKCLFCAPLSLSLAPSRSLASFAFADAVGDYTHITRLRWTCKHLKSCLSQYQHTHTRAHTRSLARRINCLAARANDSQWETPAPTPTLRLSRSSVWQCMLINNTYTHRHSTQYTHRGQYTSARTHTRRQTM